MSPAGVLRGKAQVPGSLHSAHHIHSPSAHPGLNWNESRGQSPQEAPMVPTSRSDMLALCWALHQGHVWLPTQSHEGRCILRILQGNAEPPKNSLLSGPVVSVTTNGLGTARCWKWGQCQATRSPICPSAWATSMNSTDLYGQELAWRKRTN